MIAKPSPTMKNVSGGTFEGSNWKDSSGNIKWNFKNGYQILFYYKI